MVVGADTYVTVVEADAYVMTNYRSGSAGRIRWLAMDEGDKEIILATACRDMEQLPYQGQRATRDQSLAFPRLGQDVVPERVKAAQVELAMWLTDDAKQADLDRRESLRMQGVSSFGLGDLSESYRAETAINRSLLCPKLRSLLTRYLNGGYATL